MTTEPVGNKEIDFILSYARIEAWPVLVYLERLIAELRQLRNENTILKAQNERLKEADSAARWRGIGPYNLPG